MESSKLVKDGEDKEQESYINVVHDVGQPSMISQPTKPSMRDDAKIEETVLEAKEETKQVSSKNSSPIRGEDA